MRRGDLLDVVGFDADDTLWRSQESFDEAEALFFELVGPHTPDGVDLADSLRAIELDRVPLSGYGVKAFGLSMVEAAVTATGGRVPSAVLGALVDHVHDMLRQPVELLPGVPEALAAVSATHRLVLITKGDLVHQTRKVRTSGLEHLFERVGVVLNKDVDTYAKLLGEWSITPERFVMVGNSVRSDVLPLIELGGWGVHVPYHSTWEHELVADPEHHFDELASIGDVAGWLAAEHTI
ncbi:MAG: HAD family hydrolase [Actinomycetota bacterium]|jgi:putative hydrolase of the HAD superfamily|nr:HAD family hydrolase [Actinomycetota bacterium]MDA3015191.1 HAD family hydrolase [Actinomycetota bacterium]MDA3027726.1 HAD family hydrolase [Actinomycetota bacterium]